MDKTKELYFRQGDECLILTVPYTLTKARITGLGMCGNRIFIDFDNLNTYYIGKRDTVKCGDIGVCIKDLNTFILKCGIGSEIFLKRKLCEMYAKMNLKTNKYNEKFKSLITELKRYERIQ